MAGRDKRFLVISYKNKKLYYKRNRFHLHWKSKDDLPMQITIIGKKLRVDYGRGDVLIDEDIQKYHPSGSEIIRKSQGKLAEKIAMTRILVHYNK